MKATWDNVTSAQCRAFYSLGKYKFTSLLADGFTFCHFSPNPRLLPPGQQQNHLKIFIKSSTESDFLNVLVDWGNDLNLISFVVVSSQRWDYHTIKDKNLHQNQPSIHSPTQLFNSHQQQQKRSDSSRRKRSCARGGNNSCDTLYCMSTYIYNI